MSTDIVMDLLLKKAQGQLEVPDLWLKHDIRLIKARVDREPFAGAIEAVEYVTQRNIKVVWWLLTEYASHCCEERPMFTKDFSVALIAELGDMSKLDVINAIDHLEYRSVIYYDEIEFGGKWVDCVRTLLKPFDCCPYNEHDKGSFDYFFEEEAQEYVAKEISQTNKNVVWNTNWSHFFGKPREYFKIAYMY